MVGAALPLQLQLPAAPCIRYSTRYNLTPHTQPWAAGPSPDAVPHLLGLSHTQQPDASVLDCTCLTQSTQGKSLQGRDFHFSNWASLSGEIRFCLLPRCALMLGQTYTRVLPSCGSGSEPDPHLILTEPRSPWTSGSLVGIKGEGAKSPTAPRSPCQRVSAFFLLILGACRPTSDSP